MVDNPTKLIEQIKYVIVLENEKILTHKGFSFIRYINNSEVKLFLNSYNAYKFLEEVYPNCDTSLIEVRKVKFVLYNIY